ncbi:MAG TPA: hypothetical protein VGS19_24620 [Streptosporangiaceae bacterium]|nr:hypothetical protein [Streptosporangiaceae bacterium]
MPDIDDRWYRTIENPDDPDGKPRKVPTARHGTGKRWDARWRDDAGESRHKAFERKLDAERFLTGIAAELLRGVYIDPAAGRVTLRSYAKSFLAGQTVEATTREAMELWFRLHIFPVLGDMPLAALAQRPSLIQSWARGLQSELAANYVRTVFANLSAVLSAAVDDNLIPKNPCRAGSVRPPRAEHPRVRPWSTDKAAAAHAVPGAGRLRHRARHAPGGGVRVQPRGR